MNEKLLALADAAQLFPRPPSPATWWRWRTRGIGGVKLRCWKVGGRWATTATAVADFVAALTANSQTTSPMNGETLGRTERTECQLREARLT
jgi:hypothetical protein